MYGARIGIKMVLLLVHSYIQTIGIKNGIGTGSIDRTRHNNVFQLTARSTVLDLAEQIYFCIIIPAVQWIRVLTRTCVRRCQGRQLFSAVKGVTKQS